MGEFARRERHLGVGLLAGLGAGLALCDEMPEATALACELHRLHFTCLDDVETMQRLQALQQIGIVTMPATLETLEMTPEELDACRDAVRKMAYFRWLEAGAPPAGQLDFWLGAENDWIEFNYVPHRTLDGT